MSIVYPPMVKSHNGPDLVHGEKSQLFSGAARSSYFPS